MPYLNCPSCGLVLRMPRSESAIEHCPRCVARSRRLVDLFVSAGPPKHKKPDPRPIASKRATQP